MYWIWFMMKADTLIEVFGFIGALFALGGIIAHIMVICMRAEDDNNDKAIREALRFRWVGLVGLFLILLALVIPTTKTMFLMATVPMLSSPDAYTVYGDFSSGVLDRFDRFLGSVDMYLHNHKDPEAKIQ